MNRGRGAGGGLCHPNMPMPLKPWQHPLILPEPPTHPLPSYPANPPPLLLSTSICYVPFQQNCHINRVCSFQSSFGDFFSLLFSNSCFFIQSPNFPETILKIATIDSQFPSARGHMSTSMNSNH